MALTDIGQTAISNLSNVMIDYSVAEETTDAATGDVEYRYQIKDWTQNLGYYKSVPELQIAIDAKANWTMGAGFEADEPTTIMLSRIKGTGKDTFNTILANGIRTYHIGGDSFAEIITDDDFIINLKPLDPASVVIVYDKKGRIKRYEQVSKGAEPKKFSPQKMFHLSRKRLADEVHGMSIIPSVEWIILARNEAMTDWKKVLHRNVSPLQIHYLDTDDDAKIDAYKAKDEAAHKDGEHLYVPKGTVEIEVVQAQLNQAASPLAWIDQLNNYFFQAVGVPQIIIGNAKEFTDASAKIVYLAFEQSVKEEQLYIEEQVLDQLNIEISLTFPASLQNDMVSGDNKEKDLQASQPNDTTAEMEGNT